MAGISFFRKKLERVTDEWTEQDLSNFPGYLHTMKAGHLRELVEELNRLGVPDEAKVENSYGAHKAIWDRSESRVEVSDEATEETA